MRETLSLVVLFGMLLLCCPCHEYSVKCVYAAFDSCLVPELDLDSVTKYLEAYMLIGLLPVCVHPAL